MADRSFTGIWIPKEIWLNSALNILDKAIVVEIGSLDRDERGCYASNRHFADMFGCTERQVSASVSKLVKMGYVKVLRFDGRNRYLRSTVKVTVGENGDADVNNPSSSITEPSEQPDENFQAASPKLPHSNSFSNSLRDSDSNNTKNPSDSCAEPEKPASTPQEPAVFTLPLNDGTEHRVTQADFDKYESLYPAVDVMQELRKMAGWLDGNPKNRKTKSGIRRFINSWLARAQDQGSANTRNGPKPSAFGIDRRNNKIPEKYGGGIIV